MLENQADASAGDPMWWPAADLLAGEFDRSAIGPLKAHHQLHHGRRVGTVRTDEAENLACLQTETDILHGHEAAQSPGERTNLEQRAEFRSYPFSTRDHAHEAQLSAQVAQMQGLEQKWSLLPGTAAGAILHR
jgi:hypothetical protein